MSNKSYYSSERNDKLPPIREHLSEHFPSTSQGQAHHSSRSYNTPQTSSSRGHVTSRDEGNTAANYQDPYSSRGGGDHSYHTQGSASTHTRRYPNNELGPPGYQYGVFTTDSGKMVEKATSSRDAFLLKHPRVPQDPSKRYPCSECSERFDRPAALEIHMRKHTGEKPYQCEWCGKTFNVLSNMRRHVRTHTAESAFEDDPRSSGPSSAPKHSSTHTSSNFYSSERRK